MAHRDDVDALRLRIEAQERDLRDAKAELDVLLAAARANAAAAHDPDNTSSGAFGMGFGPTPSDANPGDGGRPMSPLRAETQRRIGLLILLVTTLVTGLFLSTTHCPSARDRRVVMHRPPASAVPTAGEDGRFEPFVHFARVIDPGVPAAVALDQACAVEVTPVHGSMFDCRVVVRCDDQVLYGESSAGYNHCGPVPSRIVDGDVTRDDGDPALEVDFASGRVVIEERVGLGTQRVELQITE